MRRSLKVILSSVVIVLFTFHFVPGVVQAEESLADIKKERSKLDESRSKVANEIDDMITELEVLYKEINELESIITGNKEALEAVEIDLADVQKEIDVVQVRIDQRMEILKERAKSYQKQDSNLFLEVIFGEERFKFAELISRISLINKIAEADKELIEEQEADKALVEEKLLELKTLQDELIEIEKKATEEVKALEDSKEKLKEQEASLQAKLAQINEVDSSLSKKEKQLLQDRAESLTKMSASSATSINPNANELIEGADFAWPTVGGYVSSGVGQRWGAFHKGVDIARTNHRELPPILAVKDGVIESARYSSSYGNVIVIDHGAGLKTKYAHMSSMVVKAGDKIKQGEQIGVMGNTGDSQGVHLHLEVTEDGLLQNPLHYLQKK